MNTRSFSTKLLALVIAFLMVMSVASVAFAERSETTTDVRYFLTDDAYDDGDGSPYGSAQIQLADEGTSITRTITMPAAPTRSGYAFNGFHVYMNGSRQHSNVPAGASVSVTITRRYTSSDWRYVDAVAQWTQLPAVDTTASVSFYNNGTSSSPYTTGGGTSSVTPGTGTSATVSVTMKSAPSRSGYTFRGFNVYLGSKTGTQVAAFVAAGATIQVTLTRSSTSVNWPDIFVVGQWLYNSYDHIDIRINGNFSVTVGGSQMNIRGEVQTPISVTHPGGTISISGSASSTSGEYEYRRTNYNISNSYSPSQFKITATVVLNAADLAAVCTAAGITLEQLVAANTNLTLTSSRYVLSVQNYIPTANVCTGGQARAAPRLATTSRSARPTCSTFSRMM